ncbi:MAG: (E)-4-hydroxy-3-methylbut-2-enyl-diphosphate synthase [Pseudoflavonifractor sp.]|nr:(E)-4-hydroxy-3-methylbut-2-enyl-diphosphate synthase [Pseudoflavonifractor sp.]
MGDFDYRRRRSREVTIGGVPLGGSNPIRLQSMTSTSTLDTEGSVAQCLRIADAGADYVRLTAQGVREADNMGVIRSRLRQDGYDIPLVADIHFNPRAAFAAAAQVDKVRINPGNFVDPGRTFRTLTYTDEEYAAEIRKIEDTLVPFLDLCRQHDTAIRIGVNHGSLSDRIMSRYGDTPAGMVESAMEFLRVCVAHGFMDVVISIKASNTVIMVETVRHLVKAMEQEGMDFPLHLGVTEAGDGEDGRVKSAVGIGTLLAEGIGDTIRVSLSEEPEYEIPVAATLAGYISQRADAPAISGEYADGYDPIQPARRQSASIGIVGGDNQPVVVIDGAADRYEDGCVPDFENGEIPAGVTIVETDHINVTGALQARLHAMMREGDNRPAIVRVDYGDTPADEVMIKAAADLGTLMMNGFRDGIWIRSRNLSPREIARLSFGILQAARLRITRTEYISCPSCGRTLFDLQSVVRDIKAATVHLRGLKIGVMGCIVNGPGEMADADYGYVGAAAGKVSLYKGKTCVEKNIPASEAIGKLIDLIKAGGDWHEPQK